ncbi:DUF1003 domain-containing protein [Candidatus Woesearchaeota archaeon]|nr:DUF1003 domain-containing protein [Candidatus Woesearchaeota archaeon]
MNYKSIKHPFKHKLSFGQRAADRLTGFAGSWFFISSLLIFIGLWILTNVLLLRINSSWDSYPFILLNLGLSCLAALQAPIILMSQNRGAQRDRLRAEYDYKVNVKAEKEIEDMQKDLEEIKILIRTNKKLIKKRGVKK